MTQQAPQKLASVHPDETTAPLTLPPDDKKWSIYPFSSKDKTLRKITQAFVRDGFVCLSGVFPPSLIETLCESALSNFETCFRTMYDNGHTSCPRYYHRKIDGCSDDDGYYTMARGIKNGFREIVMRSPGRFEMPYLCRSFPFNQPDIIENEALLTIVRGLMFPRQLGNDDDDDKEEDDDDNDSIYLSNISIVIATPGAYEQKWHADGGHVNLHKHLPCHCLNVFIPLVDITPDLGPTEFRPGTHYHTRNLVPMMLAAKARKTLRQPVTPLLNMGSALLFDYRVLHRGRANLLNHNNDNDALSSSSSSRPILVLTYAKKWFKDVLNFPHRSIHDRSETKMDMKEEEEKNIATISAPSTNL